MNEAKDNYFAKAVKNETSNFDENSSEFFSSEAEMPTYKNEPPEILENYENLQPLDDPIESTFDDNDLVSDMTVDKCDFDAVFCEAFVADCGMNTFEDAPVRPPAGLSEVTNVAATSSKSEGISGACTDRKRPANTSDANKICEFCGESFQTLNDAKTHYENEHFDSHYSRIDPKRVKR